jgi:hypothetical protein
MQSKVKITFVLAAGAALLLAAAVPVMAQSDGFIRQQGPAVSGYRDAAGNYRSLADYTRDVEGIPCGIECTRAAQGPVAREYFGRTETH